MTVCICDLLCVMKVHLRLKRMSSVSTPMASDRVMFEYTTDANDRIQCYECRRPIAVEDRVNIRFVQASSSSRMQMLFVHMETCIEKRKMELARFVLEHLLVASRHQHPVLSRDLIETAETRAETDHPQLYEYVNTLKAINVVIQACWLRNAPLALPSFRLFLPSQTAVQKVGFDEARFSALFSRITIFKITAQQLDAKYPFAASTVKKAIISQLASLSKADVKFTAHACIVYLDHTESSLEAEVIVYSHLDASTLRHKYNDFSGDKQIVFHDLQYNTKSMLSPSWSKAQESLRKSLHLDLMAIRVAMTFENAAFEVRCEIADRSPMDVFKVDMNHQHLVVSCNAQQVFPNTRFYIWNTNTHTARAYIITHDRAQDMPLILSTDEAEAEERSAAGLTQPTRNHPVQQIWSHK